MSVNVEHMATALRSIRSLSLYEWVEEEAEGAALEMLAREPDMPLEFVRHRARNAGIDEFRRLTKWRRRNRIRFETLDFTDEDVELEREEAAYVESAWEDVDNQDVIDKFPCGKTGWKLMHLIYQGYNAAEAARIVGVDPSMVSIVRRQLAKSA